jgi:hypothetical protein
VGRAIKQGKLICKLFQLATFGKLTIMFVLVTIGFPCTLPHKIWLTLMMAYDMAYFIHNFCIMYYILHMAVNT